MTENITLIVNVTQILSTFVAIGAMIYAAWSLHTQRWSNELNIYLAMQARFLDIQREFPPSINNKHFKEAEIKTDRQLERTLSSYFYLANTEWSLYAMGKIQSKLADQWKHGIWSAAHRPAFRCYWETKARLFTLDPGFRKYFNACMKEDDDDDKRHESRRVWKSRGRTT